MKFRQLSVYVAITLWLVVSLTSCKNNFEDPSVGMAEKNELQIRDYLNANQLLNRVNRTSSGLYYFFTDTTSTRNKLAQLNEEIEFTYTLSRVDGNNLVLLDSANRTKSVHLPFLRGVVIPGLEEGLQVLKEGQRARFFMPSNLAFGQGSRVDTVVPFIPPYVPVVFDVELIRSRTETEQIQSYATANNLGTPDYSTDTVWVYRLTKGTGPQIKSAPTATLDYTISTLRGSTPFLEKPAAEINTGTTSATDMVGLVRGLRELYVGDKAFLIVRSSYSYGSQGIVNGERYSVPPYAPVVYEVTVKSAR
ncbi:hypothetical protein GCM10027347_07920 [Larkinella harenae]